MKLRSTRKWAEGRPILYAALSVQFAFMAEQAYGLMMALRHMPKFRSAFAVENPETWLKFYRQHRHVEASLLREHWGTCVSMSLPPFMMDVLKSYSETGKIPVPSLSPESVLEQLEPLGQVLSDAVWSSIESALEERERMSDEEDRPRRLSSVTLSAITREGDVGGGMDDEHGTISSGWCTPAS